MNENVQVETHGISFLWMCVDMTTFNIYRVSYNLNEKKKGK